MTTKTYSNFYHSLMIIFALCLFSCKKNDNAATKPETKLPTQKKASRPLPPGDENLLPTWDWTQNKWTTYFRNSSGNIGTVTTLNPFIDGSQKVFGNVNLNNADMSPAQGWMLVSRDFGTTVDANSYPFIILYNKYRGILRVCILRTNDVLSSYQEISLSFAQNSTYPKLFKYAIGDNANASSIQTAITQAGVNEWMIGDFDVSCYDNSFDNYSSFVINLREIAESNISLEGNINLQGTAQPVTSSKTGPLGQISSIAGFYSSTAEGISKITKTTASSIQNLMTSGGAAALLKTFYKLFTGFSGGGGTASVYNINLRGPITLNGKLTTTSPKTSFSVYLKNLPSVNGYRAVQNIPWGVFSIGKLLTSSDTEQSITDWVLNPGSSDYSEITVGYYRNVQFQTNFITNSSFTINPSITNDVQSIECVSIEQINDKIDQNGNVIEGPSGIIRTTYNISEFQTLSSFQNRVVNFSSKNNWYIAIGIKIIFKNGSIIYKVIPV